MEHNHFIKMVSEQRTAFNKEKVVEELKEMATHSASCKTSVNLEAQNILITWAQKWHTKLPLRLSRKVGLNEPISRNCVHLYSEYEYVR